MQSPRTYHATRALFNGSPLTGAFSVGAHALTRVPRAASGGAAARKYSTIVATPKPVAPLPMCPFPCRRSTGPAMSTWTHGVVADELLEEQPGGERAAPALAGVLHVGDFALSCSLRRGGSGSRHISSPAARPRPAALDERVVVAHHARDVRPERDHAGAGQRREVEHLVGLEVAARR